MYESGQGTPEDNAAAARWFKLAAGQNHSDAQLALGVMYANGWGVTRDDAQAIEWL